MATLTLARVETKYGVTFLDHLDRAATLPVLDRVAAQGDVLIRRSDRPAASTPVPAGGAPVVRGEVGGHTHLLVGDACYDAQPASASSLTLGVITVPDGGTALLTHEEHGGFILPPGTYEARRQREFAEQVRLVAD